MNHPQVQLLDGGFEIDDQLTLFTVQDRSRCWSTMNKTLYEGKEPDVFEHEQHLIIKEKTNTLIMGCGHAGVVNIMHAAEAYAPTTCIGGYHLMNPNSKKTVPAPLLDEIAAAMNSYADTTYYTCHCTGQTAFDYLAKKVPRLKYLSCGMTIEC